MNKDHPKVSFRKLSNNEREPDEDPNVKKHKFVYRHHWQTVLLDGTNDDRDRLQTEYNRKEPEGYLLYLLVVLKKINN